MTIDNLIKDLTYYFERSYLEQDSPSKDAFEALTRHWMDAARNIQLTHESELEEAVFDTRREKESELQEMREALAHLEEKVRQVKEIL